MFDRSRRIESRKRSEKRKPALDALEDRFVPSGLTLPAAEVSALHAHSDSGAGTRGVVRKTPMFYEFYNGPQTADLNAVSGSARLIGNRLVLTGSVAGTIVKRPRSFTQQASYVFGIDRGSPQAIAPFEGRPGVMFDAVVVAKVEMAGVSASVVDLTTGSTTPLSARSVKIAGKTVSITLNARLLPTPPGGLPLSEGSFNFWPESDLPSYLQPASGSPVASFLPESSDAPIASTRR